MAKAVESVAVFYETFCGCNVMKAKWHLFRQCSSTPTVDTCSAGMPRMRAAPSPGLRRGWDRAWLRFPHKEPSDAKSGFVGCVVHGVAGSGL